MYNLLEALNNERLHYATFKYKGVKYIFSGWWLLEWEENGEKKYMEFDTKEEFMSATIFDGKKVTEVANQLTVVDIGLDP